MKVAWYQSLRFKLFIMMSVYLLITVVGISWQNSRTFQEMLDKQNQDNVIGMSNKGAVSVGFVLDLWSGLVHSLMHNIETGESALFESSVRSFLSSNKEAVAFQVISIDKSKSFSPVLFHLTNYNESPRFEGQVPKKVGEKISVAGLKKIQEFSKNEKQDRFLQSLFTDIKLPLLQVGFRFKVPHQELTYWAVLTVWQERASSSLERSSQTRSFVVDPQGRVILTHAKDLVASSGQLIDSNLVEALRSKAQFGFKSFKNSLGKPIMASYRNIQGFDLNFVVERQAAFEAEYLEWRIRKIAIFAWIFLLVTVMASYLAAGRITRSINAAAYTTLQIAAGDLSARNNTRSRDEVGLLSAAVNHMAEQMHKLLFIQVEAARQEKELKTAQAVQSTLFPKEKNDDLGIIVTGIYQPASECAGDWWNHFSINERYKLIVIADATGHGASAALLVALAFSYFQTLITNVQSFVSAPPSPASILQTLNQIFWESGHGRSTMTMFVSVFDLHTGVFTYVNAGHVFPICIPNSEDDARLKNKPEAKKQKRTFSVVGHGTPLGYLDKPTYIDSSARFEPGDKFFFFTDGLIECTNSEGRAWSALFLKRRLGDLCDLNAHQLRDAIIMEAQNHFGQEPLTDDVTLTIVEVSKTWRPKTSQDSSFTEPSAELAPTAEEPPSSWDDVTNATETAS